VPSFSRHPVLRRIGGEQSGWTLVELLISSVLLVIILVAVLALLDTANRLGPQDNERAHDLREAQVGVYGMTRELRQAYSLVSKTGYSIEAHVWVNGADHDVTYDCTGNSSAGINLGQCIRFESTGGTRGPSTVVIDRLLNKPGSSLPPVFSYTNNSSGKTTYGSAHVEVSAKGARATGYGYRIALNDAFYMRNLNG
jgi:Tfp pilus assembly protein PilW